ncbi:MAG TPA: TonB-dependent receptor [Candidatus Acidoferrales bacterium]|nr:TonB-dependent receptor [Candidatus Acidoferrales bacterium]
MAVTVAAPALAQVAGSGMNGHVCDAQSGLPLAGASVLIIGETVSTTSDANGSFHFERLTPGTYQLRVTRAGYQPADSDRLALLAGRVVNVTLDLQAAASGAPLRLIGSTAVKTGPAVEKTTTTYRTLDPETLMQAGVDRAGDALRQLPGFSYGDTGEYGESHDTAALGDNLQLDLRGIGTLETTATLDGHPIAYGLPGGYNYDVSPIAGLRNINVTYGSGSNLFGVSAIGGIVDFQTLDPTPDDRVTLSQGYGTFDKAGSTLQATGTDHRLGYAFAWGTTSLDGPLKNQTVFDSGAAYDQSAPPGSTTYDLGIYKQDSTTVARTGVGKLSYLLSPVSKVTLTAVDTSYWDDKTGNGDANYLEYAPALAFGKELLSQYTPADYPKLPACPTGTFVATNALGIPNGYAPNGQPDGGVTCQTPAQYAKFNTGWHGFGPAWQSFNFDDYDLSYEATPQNQDIRVQLYTNRFLNAISRQDYYPYYEAPGDSPYGYYGTVGAVETGASASETLLGADNDAGIGVEYLNNAYQTLVTSPYYKSAGTPIDDQFDYLLRDIYHPRRAPVKDYLDLDFGRSTATNTSYVNPRNTIVDALTPNDAVRLSAGATTTQPSSDELDQPFTISGSTSSITCAGLNSIGMAPSSVLKPERGVDEELGYAHRFHAASLVQLTAYNVNVYDKLYQAILPLSVTGTGFIPPAYLASEIAAVESKCGAGAASSLGVDGTFNIGQLRARGLMLNGREQIFAHTFIDYDWSLDSTVLVSAPAELLASNLTLVPGSQLAGLPLHTLAASLDQTFARGIEARYTIHAVSANNAKALPAYDYSDLRIDAPAGTGTISFAVSNLFNQNAFIAGLLHEGEPLALNQYASAADYAPYVGESATERFGLPYRALFLNYELQL